LRKSRRRQPRQQAQPYDTSLKTWVKERPADILPILLPGTTYQETLDIEIIKPTMRVDKVFKVKYLSEDHILHLEFESGADNDMPSRLHAYNAILYYEHHLPVISMIIYPFRTAMAESPLQVMSGERELLTFHFLTLPLFTLNAEHYVREHIVCMYPMLPTMQGTDDRVIEQAMAELAELYREDEVTLAQQFVCMQLLLERTDTISSQEKHKIQERLDMYDPLWDEHPKVKKIQAESEARGLRNAIVTIVKTRFPDLTKLAQQKAAQIDQPEVLNYLIEQVTAAPDEEVMRWILRPSAA